MSDDPLITKNRKFLRRLPYGAIVTEAWPFGVFYQMRDRLCFFLWKEERTWSVKP